MSKEGKEKRILDSEQRKDQEFSSDPFSLLFVEFGICPICSSFSALFSGKDFFRICLDCASPSKGGLS